MVYKLIYKPSAVIEAIMLTINVISGVFPHQRSFAHGVALMDPQYHACTVAS